MNPNIKKLIQRLIWMIIGLCFAVFIVYRFYVPKSVGEKEFPLKLAWSKKLNGNVTEISITSNHVLARSGYSISVINRSDGDLLWKQLFNERTSSIITRAGRVYLVAGEYLYAFDEETGNIHWQKSLWQNIGYYPSQHGKIADISDTHIVINFISSEFRIYETQSGDYVGSAPAGRGKHDVWISNNALFTFDRYPASYDLSNGKLLWEDQSVQEIQHYVYTDGVVYYSHDGVDITAYDLETRSIIWNKKLAIDDFEGYPYLDTQANYVFIGDVNRLYIVNKQNGMLIKTITEKERPLYPQIMNNDLFVFFGFDRTVYSYDLETWNNSGVLRISPPILLDVDYKIMDSRDEYLVFFKGNTIFAYEHR